MNTELAASRRAVAGDKEALVLDLKRVIRDADVLLKDVGSVTAESLALARNEVETKVGEARVRLADTRDAVVDRARHAADTTNAYIKDNTWTVLGVAVVAAIVATVLTARR